MPSTVDLAPLDTPTVSLAVTVVPTGLLHVLACAGHALTLQRDGRLRERRLGPFQGRAIGDCCEALEDRLDYPKKSSERLWGSAKLLVAESSWSRAREASRPRLATG